MNTHDDMATMIELASEDLETVLGAGGDGYGFGGYGLGACGVCGAVALPVVVIPTVGACGTCGFATGPFVNAVTNSNVNRFAQSNSLVTSNAMTNSAFTFNGN